MRRHTRKTVATHAWLELPRESAPFMMRSVDLSLEGSRFATLHPLPLGQTLLVRLQLEPTLPTVECKGRVCWCRPMPNGLHEFGVRFVDLLEDERERIERFLIGTQARPALVAV